MKDKIKRELSMFHLYPWSNGDVFCRDCVNRTLRVDFEDGTPVNDLDAVCIECGRGFIGDDRVVGTVAARTAWRKRLTSLGIEED